MTTTKYSPSVPAQAAAAEKTVAAETVAKLFANGVERFAAVQHAGIDLAVKQNAEIMDAWTKIAEAVPSTTGVGSLDHVSNVFEQYAEKQKAILEQSQAVAGVIKERIAAAAKATEAAAAVVHQTVVHVVAAQKRVLDYSAAHTKVGFETAKQQFGLAGTPAQTAADSFQRGAGSFIEYQKALLNIVAKPFIAVN